MASGGTASGEQFRFQFSLGLPRVVLAGGGIFGGLITPQLESSRVCVTFRAVLHYVRNGAAFDLRLVEAQY